MSSKSKSLANRLTNLILPTLQEPESRRYKPVIPRRPSGPKRSLLNLEFAPQSNGSMFNLYRPVIFNEQLVGFVLISYRNTVLDRMLMQSALHVNEQLPLEAFLVDDKGQIIRHLSLDASGLVQDHPCPQPSSDGSTPDCLFPPKSLLEGEQILEASESLPFSEWRVHFTQSSGAVVASLRSKIAPWLFVILFVTVIILYLSHLAIKRTMRPLNGLTNHVQHTLEDHDHPTSYVGESDEVQTLTHAFDELTNRLNRTLQDLRLARDHAESANQIKSEFLAHMSHEIRTPLTAVVGFSELMQDASYAEGHVDRETLRIIERNARHLLALVNDILDFSKIEAQELQIQQEIFDPIAVAHDVLDGLQTKARDKNLELSLSHENEPAAFSILGDALRFRQVLINLVDNGIKYTEQGEVEVSISLTTHNHEQGELNCRVTDTGIGMSADEIHKLFLPFSQLSGRGNNTPGTGLGLAICRRLAQLMGGDITCQSKPGQGSQFTWNMNVSYQTLSDPSIKTDSAASVVTQTVDHNGRANILIAEDALDSQELLRWILEQAGATVTIARNGQEAIEQVALHETQEAFDLVLMDIGMPLLNGYEATTELRKRGFTRPILALTAHATAGDRDRCASAGCNDYLTKPIDRQTLLHKIRSHVPEFGVFH